MGKDLQVPKVNTQNMMFQECRDRINIREWTKS